MTKLEVFMAENNISFYKLAQALGKNPLTTTGIVKQKIVGERSVSMVEFYKICDQLSQISTKQIDPATIDYDVLKMKLK